MTDLQTRKAVAVLEDYIIDSGFEGTLADKIACVERILSAVGEYEQPDEGADA